MKHFFIFLIFLGIGSAGILFFVFPSISKNNQDIENKFDTAPIIEPSKKEEKNITSTKTDNQQSKLEIEESQPDENIYSKSFPFLAAKKSENGIWFVQQDILIDENSIIQKDGENSEIAIAKIDSVKYWETRNIPFQITGHNSKDTTVHEAISIFNNVKSYHFIENNDENDFVDFVISDQDICQSYLGKKGGRQEIIIGKHCNIGNILHEMMHVIGFVHEQSREDRDQYVNILWENILQQHKSQFQILPSKISIPVNSEFDFDSVLMYSPYSFSNGNGPTMKKLNGGLFVENRNSLSEQDSVKLRNLFKEFVKE